MCLTIRDTRVLKQGPGDMPLLELCINSCNPYNTTPQWVKPILSLMLFSFQLQCFVHVHTCICILNWSLSIKVWFHEKKTCYFLFWSIIKSALNKNSSMTDENRLADHYEKIGWALLVRIDWAVLMRIGWELLVRIGWELSGENWMRIVRWEL